MTSLFRIISISCRIQVQAIRRTHSCQRAVHDDWDLMTSNAEPGPSSGNGPVGVSGPTQSLWLRLLVLSQRRRAGRSCPRGNTGRHPQRLAGGVLSSTFGGLLVMAFFAISLLVGHFVGRNNPSGAIGSVRRHLLRQSRGFCRGAFCHRRARLAARPLVPDRSRRLRRVLAGCRDLRFQQGPAAASTTTPNP